LKDFEAKILNLREFIDNQMDSIAGNLVFDAISDLVYYSLSSKGKRLRPILLILVGSGFGAELTDLIHPALAIEILHTFTLIHDDIMDSDYYRRGRETVHKKFGINSAILAGDALMSLAFRELAKAPRNVSGLLVEELSNAMLEICDGQQMDMDFEKRYDISKSEYLRMIEKKTGRLIATACKFGGILAVQNAEILQKLEEFGRLVGVAFQIQDDLLEVISTEEKMGKSLKSDLESGKKTFLVVDYMEKLSESERVNFCEYLITNSDNKTVIIDLFSDSGTIQNAVNLIREYLEKAKLAIGNFPINLKSDLIAFIDYLSNRQN